ncbi:MAG TPA: Gfo/Idh/MocA family oxidoreductase [Ignavibacteria bacterium]|nr:Gfo/Idh/MocA family oxidoreductase [Ignavibacteria bacterium]
MQAAVIGIGYWGPNLIRNFLASEKIEKVYVFDINKSRLDFVRKRFPLVTIADSVEQILDSDKIEMVAIATPVDKHFDTAMKALKRDKHIWVEKPFTSSVEQALILNQLAAERNLNIFVDHTFIYTGAVKKMKEIIDNNELGDLLYFDSVRINLGLFQSDVNVIWDLAPHDLSIMFYLMNKKPVAIAANGVANYYGHENIAHISVYFENNCFAHFHVNWTSPVKIRRMIAGGNKKMLVFDDMENSEKIKVYDSGIEMKEKEGIYNALVQYRIGDMYSPKLVHTEALALGVEEFINSIIEKRKPLTNGDDGLNVVKILEASDASIKQKGKLITL